MFRIITQDGRTLEIKRNPAVHEILSAWTDHNLKRYPELEDALTVTFETNPRYVETEHNSYWHFDKVLNEVVGYFKSDSSRQKASDMLRAAWNRGDSQFVVPQDNLPKSDAERFEDFAAENNLICVSINELGYKQSDIPRNLRIWRTSDHFERQNILVADEDGSYETSLKKWKKLHKEVAA